MKKIRISFSFLLFNAFLFMFRDMRLIAEFYGVCLLHELGHIAALRFTGGELRRVELSWYGIKMTAAPAANTKRGIIVLMSGPAVNILLYAVLHAAGSDGSFALINLAEGLFNLLPYSFLDGGAALEMLAQGAVNERLISRLLLLLRAAVTAGLALLAVRICLR